MVADKGCYALQSTWREHYFSFISVLKEKEIVKEIFSLMLLERWTRYQGKRPWRRLHQLKFLLFIFLIKLFLFINMLLHVSIWRIKGITWREAYGYDYYMLFTSLQLHYT